MDSERPYLFNGVDGDTGTYAGPVVTAAEVASWARGQPAPADVIRGIPRGVDADDLAQAGWGVVFASDADPALRSAVSSLVKMRREQAGQLYQELVYQHGQTANKFLEGHGGGFSVVPEKVPYYLCLVGGPGDIPYSVQFELGVQHAVGRIAFEEPCAYQHYADSVVAFETNGHKPARRAGFFATENPDDLATQMSHHHLVWPLADEMTKHFPSWGIEAHGADAATKGQLRRLLGGDETPDVLFTASHGLRFDPGSRFQRLYQGALLCQEWPGPGVEGPTYTDHFFAASDLAADADLAGLIAFLFACYSAGTPRLDSFPEDDGCRPRLADHPFVSPLPRRMLTHPAGGALAVVGHIDRAWGTSFLWSGMAHIEPFSAVLKAVFRGQRLGHAFDPLSERYGVLAARLTGLIERERYGERVDDVELADFWLATRDARAWVILGDPAVRLPPGLDR